MKKCKTCNIEKDLDQYYKHKEMLDGHLNICKECTKIRVGKHREVNREKIRAYDRGRASLPHRKELNLEMGRRARKRNPLFNRAHNRVTRAVKKGTLIKPNKCSKCNTVDVKIEGHHPDYTKPLDVIWLCVLCHRQLHLGKQEAP